MFTETISLRSLGRRSIKAKLRLSAVITIGLAMVVALTVSLQYRDVGQATRTERFAHQVIKDLSDLDSLGYAYLLFKDNRPKVQWHLKHTSIGKLLSEDVTTTPAEQAVIDSLRSNHKQMKDLFNVIVKNTEEGRAGTQNAFSPYDELNEGLTAQILSRSEMMMHDASLLGRETGQGMDTARQRSFFLVLASAFLLIVSAVLTAFFLAKSIGGSILRLEQGTQRIADGDLRYRVDVEGDDEISRLAAAFNDMTAKLQTSHLSLELEIGERKQAEEALKDLNQTLEQRIIERTAELATSEQRWATTLASIGDAVIATDLAGRITFINPIAQALTGWPHTEAVGQPIQNIFRIINEKTLEPEKDMVQQVLQEGAVIALSNSTALITREGKAVPIEDSAASIKDKEGKVTGVVLVFHDVSEKRRAQEALWESDLRYSVLFNKAPFAAALTRMPEGHLTDINEAFLKLFEYTRDELIGKTSVEIGISDLDSQKQIAAELKDHGSVRNFECTRFTKSSAQRVLSLNLDWVGTGGKKQLLTTIHDITERKQAEEALKQRTVDLQQLTDTLEARVKERTVELADLTARLVSAQENERERISYELHDKVWQNLVAIRFTIENLFSAREDWEALRRKARQVTADMLDTVGKIRSMQGDLWPYVLDDIGLVATLDWYCREFEKNHPDLAIKITNGIAETDIPPEAKIVIYRILQEALNNIAKHSRADRVTIRLSTRDHGVVFSIEDNGVGFDPKEAIGQKAPWVGLGLLSIKARTELSGGVFALESAKGKGTTVRARWS
ncbi:MAG: PAS domain S-box protein [Deltaproteobacteria bacterium]|nr:PAS domain S-box protein [Deltaproteobacteria bacterium]